MVLASGAGSTFAALADAAKQKTIDCEIIALVVSKSECGAIGEAKKRNITVRIVDPATFRNKDLAAQSLQETLKSLGPNWIVLAGYTQLLSAELVSEFKGRIVNTHPSLLPKYGGKGMYGMRVHEAVLNHHEKETGVTVHIVTEEYDEGPIVAQKKVAVRPDDTPHTLAKRVQEIEKELYVESLRALFSNRT